MVPVGAIRESPVVAPGPTNIHAPPTPAFRYNPLAGPVHLPQEKTLKLITYQHDGYLQFGVVHQDRVGSLAGRFASARAFLEGGEQAIAQTKSLVETAIASGAVASWPALAGVNIKAPILDPRKIFALAGNYREHIREGGGEVVPKEQQVPQVFVKPVTTIIGLNDEIRLPGPICTSVDYEGELGIVIGRRCHYVDAAEALDYVAGYLNFNDVSGRKLNISAERKPMPRTPFFDWLNGKWFDTFAPTGPFLVLKDEIEDPHALDLELRVNGEVRQTASTGDMIFSVAETVAWVSQFATLDPGDIIATGTPSGVGAVEKSFLKPGDVVEVEITGLGTLRNTVAPALTSR